MFLPPNTATQYPQKHPKVVTGALEQEATQPLQMGKLNI